MKKQFTPDYILENKGCYSKEQVEELSFISKPIIDIQDIINSEIKLKDKWWFVMNKCDLTLGEKKAIALKCAKIVVGIYNKKYPNDTRIQDCINAIELFNECKITIEELLDKSNAAYASTTAAYAAAYADAAAYAAYAAAAAAAYAAATDAAYAAAYAADAAAYASAASTTAADAAYAAAYADAAAYAAYAAYAAAGSNYTQQLDDLLQEVCK